MLLCRLHFAQYKKLFFFYHLLAKYKVLKLKLVYSYKRNKFEGTMR